MPDKPKLFRIATIPASIAFLLRGQLGYMSGDYDVVAVASSHPEGALERAAETQGVRGYTLQLTRKITPLTDMRAVYRLYRILRREKPLFVHTHTPKAGLVGMLAAYLARVPFRMHDIAGLPLVVETGFKRALLIWIERLTYRLATHVYPNSHNLKALALELKLAADGKMLVLGNGSSNGVDTEAFSQERIDSETRKEIFKEVGFKPSDLIFIFIGRLVRDKGINELVAAFTGLCQAHPDIKLLMIGHYESDLDPLKPETHQAIETHPQIMYVGPKKDVRPYLAISDALVFPTYREGFPNVPMEAGSMGLPAIVTDINGCNEIIEHEVNGLIIPPQQLEPLREAMERFIREPDLLARLAQNARPMIADRYEQESVWKLILAEYRRLEQSHKNA